MVQSKYGYSMFDSLHKLPGLVVKGFLLECHLSVLKIDKLA